MINFVARQIGRPKLSITIVHRGTEVAWKMGNKRIKQLGKKGRRLPAESSARPQDTNTTDSADNALTRGCGMFESKVVNWSARPTD